MMKMRDHEEMIVSIPDEMKLESISSTRWDHKMKMKKTKSNKSSSSPTNQYDSQGASWSISNANIALIKHLRSHSMPPSHTDHIINSNQNPAKTIPNPNPYNPRPLQEPTYVPATMNIGAGAENQEEENDEIYNGFRVNEAATSFTTLLYVQCVALLLLLSLLGASFHAAKLKQYEIFGVLLWKWSLMALVILCGELVTGWAVHLLAFLIEKKLILKNKALYYVYGLKRSLQICIWMPSFLLTWFLVFDNDFGQSSRRAKTILGYIWKTFASALLVVVVAELKSFLVKKLSSSFFAKNFFWRIRERIFNKYIIQRMAGELEKAGQLEFDTVKGVMKGSVERGVINVEKLQKVSDEESVSAWTMNGLVNAITSGLINTSADQGMETETDDEESLRGSQVYDVDEADPLFNLEISNEREARFAASFLFRKCAKPGCKFIEEDDLLKFFPIEEVNQIFPMFEGAVETGKISKKSFRNWMDKVYSEHRNLAFVLADNRENIEQVNKLGTGAVIVIAPIIWLLLMGFPLAPVAVFLASLLLLAEKMAKEEYDDVATK